MVDNGKEDGVQRREVAHVTAGSLSGAFLAHFVVEPDQHFAHGGDLA